MSNNTCANTTDTDDTPIFDSAADSEDNTNIEKERRKRSRPKLRFADIQTQQYPNGDPNGNAMQRYQAYQVPTTYDRDKGHMQREPASRLTPTSTPGHEQVQRDVNENGNKDGSEEKALKLELELDLDIELELKARIRGGLTLALLK